MERMLYEASLTGDVNSLKKLLEEDPLILDRSLVLTGFYETPLHIAAMRGHVDFAKLILSCKPELASEMDSHGFCPLHYASANKNVEMVQVLLNTDICMVTDEEGRTPLHLATMKGRLDIMKVLIAKQPKAIQVVSNRRRETILHLCVKYNHLEALKLLMENLKAAATGENETIVDISKAEKEFISVNSMDDDGNTILHLAVARRQIEMIEYLLEGDIGIQINALNNFGFTSLDTLAQFTGRDIKDVEIGDLLRGSGGFRAKDGGLGSSDKLKRPLQHQTKWETNNYEDWLEKKTSALLVAATLLATLGFQAGLTPPGGVWQEDSSNSNTTSTAQNSPSVHFAGRSILADRIPNFYLVYMVANTLGFIGSLNTMIILVMDLHRKRKIYYWYLVGNIWMVTVTMGLVYAVSVTSMMPPKLRYPRKGDMVYPVDLYPLSIINGCMVVFFALPLAIFLLTQLLPIMRKVMKDSMIEQEKIAD